MPSFLFTTAIVTEAGLQLVPAIEFYCRQTRSELSRELERTLREIHLGVPAITAFLGMAQRWQSPELNRFVTALVQALEKGGEGVARTMRSHSDAVWDRHKRAMQERGHQASVRLFFILLILIMPSVLMILAAPALYGFMKFLG